MKTKPYKADDGNKIYYFMVKKLYYHDEFVEYELTVALSKISYDTSTKCKNNINKL